MAETHILVVEDEFFLADDLCRNRQKAGAVVVGSAPSVPQALGPIAATPALDAAVLEINLSGTMASPVADALTERSVPSSSRPECLRKGAERGRLLTSRHVGDGACSGRPRRSEAPR